MPWGESSALLQVTSSGQANSCPGNALLSPVSAEEPGVSSPRDPPAWEKLVFDHLKSLSFHTRREWLDCAGPNLPLTPGPPPTRTAADAQRCKASTEPSFPTVFFLASDGQ